LFSPIKIKTSWSRKSELLYF